MTPVFSKPVFPKPVFTKNTTARVIAAVCLACCLSIVTPRSAQADDQMLPEIKAPAGTSAEAALANVEEPSGLRMDHYREPVPKTLAGAKVVPTVDVEALHAAGKSVFIDVYPRAPKPPNLPAGTIWRDPPHLTIPGAVWLPNVGYGVVPPETETAFKAHLENVSGGDKAKTIVLYCLRNCWMSWNAAKRAVSYGYTNVAWFPDGNDGWQEAGNELNPTQPLP